MAAPNICISDPALEGVLGQHCLPRLTAQQLLQLRAASRATQDLVDGDTHEAWQVAAAGLLRPSMQPLPGQTGLDWQAAIRQEWLSQRPLRTASLQFVHKVEPNLCGHSHISFWVAGAAPDSPCYLISRLVANGAWVLLDPSLRNAQPKQLDLTTRALCHAFVPADGRLHIVELMYSKPGPLWYTSSLRWHTIDTATGRTLASEEKHMWLKHDCKSIFHVSGKVLGLVDSSTLAIMDAMTLHELGRFDISPRHTALLQAGSSRLSAAAWSGSGTLLAVAICSSPGSKGTRPQGAVAQVLVFDTASGRCLQSVPMLAYRLEMKWSPGPADLLAVSSVWKRPDVRGHTALGRMLVPDPPQADLRLLRSYCQEVAQLNCTVPEFSRAQWTEPYWSPHGHLLVAGWHSNDSTYQQGCTIFDPKTLEQISTFPQDPRSISWALKPPSSLQRSRLSAFFPELRADVSFISHGSGSGWSDVCKHCDMSQACTGVNFSPCGTTLVLPSMSLTGVSFSPCGTTLMLPSMSLTGNMCAFHFSRHPFGSDGFVMPELPIIGGSRSWLQFAPIPPHWPQIYAYLHLTEAASGTSNQASRSSRGPAAISLVEAGSVEVLSTWSVQHLNDMVKGPQADASHEALRAEWAPNGRHLAVLGDTCITVMTFEAIK